MIGLLFGKQVGLEVTIIDAIELAQTASGGLDHEFLKKQVDLYTVVYKERELLGWYSIAKAAAPEHLALHREFLAYNESPLLLLMDPEPSGDAKDLPMSVLESETQMVDNSPTMLFVTIPFQLETLQAERISMEHVAKAGPDEGESSLDSHVEAVDTSVRTLGDRVTVMVDYLRSVQSGTAEVDYGLLRQIANLCDQLPGASTDDLDSDFMRDYNDSLMVSYLANVTKNASAVNDLSDKFMLINSRGSKLV